MRTLGRFLIPVGLILTSVLLFGCGGGGGSDEARPNSPSVDPPLVRPVGHGAQIARGLKGIALVSQPFNSRVAVVPYDRRNEVVGLSISNATQGGAAPTIDANGNISWSANELDFESTRELIVTATMREGPAVQMRAPVAVRKERLVHQTQLPASAGTIADPNGRFLIKVEPEAPGLAMNGTLSISEVFSANGSFTYVVRVPVTSGAKVTVLDAPATLDSALRSTADAAAGTVRSRLSAASQAAQPRAVAAASAAAASGLTANIGGALAVLLSGYGRVAANAGGQMNVYTSRTKDFQYTLDTVLGLRESWGGELTSLLYQIDGSCPDPTSCASANSASPARWVPSS